jgi:hypothetical protein
MNNKCVLCPGDTKKSLLMFYRNTRDFSYMPVALALAWNWDDYSSFLNKTLSFHFIQHPAAELIELICSSDSMLLAQNQISTLPVSIFQGLTSLATM